MPKMVPFRGYRARPEFAGHVSTIAFESIDQPEELHHPEAFPYTYLRAVKPDLFDAALQQKPAAIHKAARDHFEYLVGEGILVQDEKAALYIYRQVDQGFAYTGILGLASTSDYQHHLIKKHEATQAAKEQAIVDYFQQVGINGSPVLLTYDDDGRLEAELRRTIQHTPDYDFWSPIDAKRHQMWVRDDQAFQDLARDSMQASPAFYIADGHHRCAATARWREQDPQPANQWFMAFWLSTSQMNIHSFNRLIRDIPGLEAPGFVAQLRQAGVAVQAIDPPHRSILSRQELLLWIQGYWFHLTLPRTWMNEEHPASQLEVTQLQEYILKPMLGITDSRTDERIQYAYGSGEPAAMGDKAAREGYQAVFLPPPIAVHQLLRVADLGGHMPPKSTWVEPKLRSGLLIHSFEQVIEK